ncbi:hypothetical protein SAMN02745216_02283 [Desulfatibacillum alkenivorans DSM 16219]|jgi:hypothetical protein|uniref:Uncharacterized protein n=1 Tax=Desulfatibacillum alkenivorans DSM 16219 TaxID=1121393 RepID=A0A1M6M981_9BACT|nr:hypothetical protein [Desulfatibacillum alkenivorans]SHJ79984.1 hypothetical protein SAMN02745216_02283 [Desulfatibacillum alkenivorans DSM 16219]
MEELKARTLVMIFSAIISALLGGSSVYKFYTEKLDEKTILCEDYRHKWHNAKSKVSSLEKEISLLNNKIGQLNSDFNKQKEQIEKDFNKQHKEIKKEFNSLQEEYNSLNRRYYKATSTGGLTYEGPSIETSWQEVKLSTGDRVHFKLPSASLFMKITKITKKGPVIKFTGAIPRLTQSSLVSEKFGDSCYLLSIDQLLHFQVSGKASKEGYLKADLSDLEDIYVKCLSYDVSEQVTELKFRKQLVGG